MDGIWREGTWWERVEMNTILIVFEWPSGLFWGEFTQVFHRNINPILKMIIIKKIIV